MVSSLGLLANTRNKALFFEIADQVLDSLGGQEGGDRVALVHLGFVF